MSSKKLQGNIRTDHNLVCYWCDHENDINGINQMFEAFPGKQSLHWSCDHCGRRSRVYRSRLGFYNLSPADRARYIRNMQKGTERLITLADIEIKIRRR
jgi:hypothetical protein